ncbi:glycosyltransferase [Microbacterium trichothecenolyticum]|uniref:D-inositol 3-phosphate glycosyltransferase n=1 Tax=Microbacterium trichothecenolyticum TaxID=69370 RepID=A0A0M2H9N8_MICTR|nr:glycosyltransferase [Microbacterium trichothecenolyticum]KJL40824.1 GDP-mannose:cellobiosyl-diphosphopolyprenol alpha-mannosyltransferase [Microbacterium trichothecenolyticum]
MKGLLVHEWIAKNGGSENVFARLADIYPDADLLCLWNDAPHRFDPARTRETWLAGSPLRGRKAAALPLMPATWRNRKESADWMLVSSHLFAHQITLSSGPVPKFVYVHTPARYIWAPDLDLRGASLPARAIGALFKPIDRKRATSATSIAANSEFIAGRIREAWHRDATVIYPPVETSRIQAITDWADELTAEEAAQLEALPPQYVLGASRFVSYKRLDLVIAAGEAADVPVVLAGTGPDEDSLRARAAEARVPVHFVHRPSDALLYALYQRALVFVFPPIEDFGIMPVEAMATGTPVIVNSIGGARESVAAPVAGTFFESEDASELRRAVEVAAAVDRSAVAARAREFSAERFDEEIRSWVDEHVGS